MNYDLTQLNNLAHGDDKFILDMLRTFVHNTPPAVERMLACAADGKFEIVGREAHSMIPGVSLLGAMELKEELVRIEENVKNANDLESIPEGVDKVKKYMDDLIAAFKVDFNLELP